MTGPAPTSKATLKARGSWRAEDRPDELELAPGVPQPEGKLSKPRRKLWDFFVAQLGPKGVLSEADGPALTILVRLVDQENKLDAVLEKMLVGTTDWKRVSVSLSDTRRQLKDYFARFGLTPADRPRVKLDKPKGNDGKSRFFQPKLTG